jgi:hypothetical protein
MTEIYHGAQLRSGRYSQNGQIYLITAVTHNREPFFNDLRGGAVVGASISSGAIGLLGRVISLGRDAGSFSLAN